VSSLRPLAPLDTVPLFAGLGDELLDLLRGLRPEQWTLPTSCPGWQVRDIAAHLLDSGLRRIAIDRDGQPPPPPAEPVTSYRQLVTHLDRLNAEWVQAMRRLSPASLIELLEQLERRLPAVLAALEPRAKARFAVAWAGEEESQVWFDVARELTERWHHQQQIRLAVGAPPLTDPRWSRPVLETFLRALPHRYRSVEAPPGAALEIRIAGAEPYVYTLRREAAGWSLWHGAVAAPDAAVALDEETAWRLLTNGLAPAEAGRRAAVAGERPLILPLFETLAVMA
jgi:uncharacterized protein (TIGR03083 family)